MKRIEYLISRSISLYQNMGFTGVVKGIEKYIRHGSLRNDFIRMVPANKRLIHTYIKLGHTISSKRYTDADPFKIFWVNPSQIEYCISGSQPPAKFGRVYSGDWDITNEEFTSKTTYQSLHDHFIENIPWEETQYYKNKYKKLKKGKPTRGCSSVEDLPKYFAEIDDIYTNIIQEGYKKQKTLQSEKPIETTHKNLDAPTSSMNEIGVSIGRNGTLLKHVRGRHRLAIAKIAGINQIPVQIIVRHEKWQSLRDKIKNTKSDVSDIPNKEHPDLEDVL